MSVPIQMVMQISKMDCESGTPLVQSQKSMQVGMACCLGICTYRLVDGEMGHAPAKLLTGAYGLQGLLLPEEARGGPGRRDGGNCQQRYCSSLC